MSTENQQDSLPLSPESSRDEGRRRLIRGGLAAGPVILSLGSQPVFGTTNTCMTPSKTLSAALSQAAKHQGDCTNSRSVPTCRSAPGTNGGVAFHTIFKKGGAKPYLLLNNDGSSKTMAQVLTESGSDATLALPAQFACAYLNVMSGITFKNTNGTFSALPTLQNVWASLVTTGSYNPTAGTTWGPQQIGDYLHNNRIAPRS